MEEYKNKTKQTYNKIANSYSETHFKHFWIEEFELYKKLLQGNKVLDIGCGAGRDAVVFVENNFDYTGIDASSGMLEVARARVPSGKFQEMDFYHLEFPDNTFDGFWSAAAFLHVPKLELPKVLREAYRVIKAEGIGFISLKQKTELDEGLIHEEKFGGIDRYFSFFQPLEFKEILERNAFEVIKMWTHAEDDKIKTNWLCYFIRKSSSK